MYDNNSCFAIIRVVAHDKYVGTYVAYGVLWSYPSRAEAEAAAKRSAADTSTNVPDMVVEIGTIDLVECAGVR